MLVSELDCWLENIIALNLIVILCFGLSFYRVIRGKDNSRKEAKRQLTILRDPLTNPIRVFLDYICFLKFLSAKKLYNYIL